MYSTPGVAATAWALGDYFQASTSTLDFEDISISFDATGSNTGPRDFTLAYSTDGNTFTDFGNYTLVNASWSSSATFVNPSTAHFDFDLSAVAALEHAAVVYFRLVNTSTTSINGGTTASGGTSRVDNFTIAGTAVPEPGALGLVGIAGIATLRRRRKS